jgi:enoyl-CoA hydratase
MPEPEPLTVQELVTGSDQDLVAATRGDVRLLVFNRPEVRNAMSLAVRQDFARLTAEAEADEAINVVVVTGAHGVFSSGVDLKELRAAGPRPIFRPHPAEAARAMTKPTIAAVDGPCVTGALELALSCSFIIASERARFADTHASVGLFPAWGQSALLPRAIGTRRARQMSFTGEFINAATASRWGLVNEVTSPEDLLTRCLALAAAIGHGDRRSIRWQLELMSRNDGAPFDVALAAEEAAVRRWRADSAAGSDGSRP